MKKESNNRKSNLKNKFEETQENAKKNQSKIIATIIQIAYFIVAGVVVTEILNKYPQLKNNHVGIIVCITLILGVAIFHLIEYFYDSDDEE